VIHHDIVVRPLLQAAVFLGLFPGVSMVDPEFSCTFERAPQSCGFAEQSRGAGRVSLVHAVGMNGVRLHTRPGDSDVHGSRTAERSDLRLSQQASGCFEGREHWWAHSVLFPDDCVAPPESTATDWHFGVVADFHNAAPGAGQANFQVNAMPATAMSPDRPTGLAFNGVQKMAYRGPTLYPGQGCYFKLANYHSAFGKPSSVIHARVVRGSTPRAVSAGPLEGVLRLRQASRSGR